MSTRRNYNFTVDTLLDKAHRNRTRMSKCGRDDTDHIVEMQLVVAALNNLRQGSYWSDDWTSRLVDFFNHRYSKNLQCLKPSLNQKKRGAVNKLLRRKKLTKDEKASIKKIERHWNKNKRKLRGFKKFKSAMDEIL